MDGEPRVVDEAVQGRAAAPLRCYVAWYSGYRQQGVPAARHRGLIFTLDDPLMVARHPDPRQEPGIASRSPETIDGVWTIVVLGSEPLNC